MGSESVIDNSTLAILQDAIGEDFAELIPVFIESTNEILQQLKTDYDQQDIESFTRQAHSLKSSSANLGGFMLSEISAELEKAGHQGQFPVSAEFILPIEKIFSLMEKELQQYQN
jgi:HPt (histidine-containing phosphotransfer) domain-containing protein